MTISERPSPAPGTPPASTRGAQSGGSSLLGLQGAGLPAGNTGNLGFQRKGVQASASPVLLDQTAHHPSQNPPRWPESDAPSEKEVPGPDPTQ